MRAGVGKQAVGLVVEVVDQVALVLVAEQAVLESADDVEHPGHHVAADEVALVAVEELLNERIGVGFPLLVGVQGFGLAVRTGHGILLMERVGSFPLTGFWRKADGPQSKEGFEEG